MAELRQIILTQSESLVFICIVIVSRSISDGSLTYDMHKNYYSSDFDPERDFDGEALEPRTNPDDDIGKIFAVWLRHEINYWLFTRVKVEWPTRSLCLYLLSAAPYSPRVSTNTCADMLPQILDARY